MIRFIWQNCWRNKERFILLLVGAFIISSGLSYLVGLSEANKETVMDSLQNRWSASYDIVVRPEGTQSVTEEKNLLEPNYLSGLNGGISMEQYETIKAITDVEVAAPIAMIGYTGYEVNFGNVQLEDTGLYRKNAEIITDTGVNDNIFMYNFYFPKGSWNPDGKDPEYGVGGTSEDLTVGTYALLAGIDPEQEAKLVGLDQAILSLGESRYFNENDQSITTESSFGSIHNIPVIVNNHPFVDQEINFTFERLDLPFNDPETAAETMEMVRENGGETYLDTVKGTEAESLSFTGEEAFQLFVNSITGIDMESGEPFEGNYVKNNSAGNWMSFRTSPLQYTEVASPFSNRWPFAYQLARHQNNDDIPAFSGTESFREPVIFGDNSEDWPRINPQWIGFYDPGKLDIAKDPTNELPMETYRPASAELVLDENAEPINPPSELKPTDNPYDFLTNPPSMLTTLEAAEQILGDKPIAAIRVKVAGVSSMSEESKQKLEAVAAQIEEETGLITDITLGSSPQPTLTYVPSINEDKAVGWLQQPWVKIGSSIAIFRETSVGFAGVIASVMAVAVVYVWATSLVSLYARRKEFAVLLAVGWRPGQLTKLLFLESAMLGLFIAMISWLILGIVYAAGDTAISPARFLLTGIFGFVVYVLGAVIPAYLVRKISPYETMRTGEVSKGSKRVMPTRGLCSLAFHHLIGKWRRSLLSIVAISLPAALLAFFLYITLRLRGVMFTTWLGQYVALEVGPVHYAAMAVALLIAVLTTAEIMWQNIAERREEIALLKAVGWQNKHVRLVVLIEGMLSGFFAAVLGLVLAIAMMWAMYRQFPTKELWFLLATGLIPVIVGFIGAILPAERAVKILPTQGMAGSYSNRKAIEKRFKWGILAASCLLFTGFIYTMIQVAPEMAEMEQAANTSAKGSEILAPTIGKVAKENTDNTGNDIEINNTVNGSSGGNNQKEESEITEYSNDLQLGELFDTTTEKFLIQEYRGEVPTNKNGTKNFAFEFNYENLDTVPDELNPKIHFKLYSNKTKTHYYPTEVTIIESEKWENGKITDKNGYVKAVIVFTIPEEEDDLKFTFRTRHLANGINIILPEEIG
ncbi:FtsX-like permease family protein [Bacillaceae bacterium Marseille-Q3522]|nr:FtsX-like permease family protein [Bacillaceae bacterium Marseille-Q3522]